MQLSAFALLAILASANALTNSAPVSPMDAVSHTVNLFNGVDVITATVGHPDISTLPIPAGGVRAACVMANAAFSSKEVVAALRMKILWQPTLRSGTPITVWHVVMPLNHALVKNAGSSSITCLGVIKWEEGLTTQGGRQTSLPKADLEVHILIVLKQAGFK
ncbi:hypothetical protein V494_08514 [Pseudogymnoascus sp. VKM F-4513 (FW-928)]|nr:hypothetical protein V494_08514 [Pseudogymnoascus sp. VKM F-4513 (FW-928)]